MSPISVGSVTLLLSSYHPSPDLEDQDRDPKIVRERALPSNWFSGNGHRDSFLKHGSMILEGRENRLHKSILRTCFGVVTKRDFRTIVKLW